MTDAQQRVYAMRLRMPPDMRERVDAMHAALNPNWVPWEERGCRTQPGRCVPLEMAPEAPAEQPKREIRPDYVPQTKTRVGLQTGNRRELTGIAPEKVDRNTCPHEKWQQQGRPGTRLAEYERCTRCGKGRIIGREAKAPGKPRICPKVSPQDCPHKPEWRSVVKKNGKQNEKCKACLTVRLSLDEITPTGPKRKANA